MSDQIGHYTVSRVGEEDLSAIAEIESAVFSRPWSKESLRLLLAEGNIAFLVRDDAGQAVGYGGMQCVLDEGQITDIAVLPDYRRQGIGSVILTALKEYARNHGCSVLFLEVRVSNLPALGLYRDRFGFEVLGVRKRFYRDPTEDAYNMRLFL